MYNYRNLIKHLRNIYPLYDTRFTEYATLKSITIPTTGDGELIIEGADGIDPSNITKLTEPSKVFEHGISKLELINNFNFRVDQFLNGEFITRESVRRFGTALKITLSGDNKNSHDFTLGYLPKSVVTISGINDYPTPVLELLNKEHRLVGYGKDYLIVMPLKDTDAKSLEFYSELSTDDLERLLTGEGLEHAKVIDILEIKEFTHDTVLELVYQSSSQSLHTYAITNISNHPSEEYSSTHEQGIVLGNLIRLATHVEGIFENLEKVKKSTTVKIRPMMYLLPLTGSRVDDTETRADLDQTAYSQGRYFNYISRRRFAILVLIPTKEQNKMQEALLDAQDTILLSLCKTLIGLDPNIYEPRKDIVAKSNITLESDSVVEQDNFIYIHEYIFSFSQGISGVNTVDKSGTNTMISGGTRALKCVDYEVGIDLNLLPPIRDFQESEQVESTLETPNIEIT